MESTEEMDVSSSLKLKSLNCVVFPGIVNNAEQAIINLGGIAEIAYAFESPEAVLSVNLIKSEFGPSLAGNKKYERSLLVSVKTKYKVNKRSGEKVFIKVLPVQIIGFVQKTFKFTSIVDFVYFPPKPNCSDLWNINKLFDMNWALEKNVPLMLLPGKLGKFSDPQSDFYDSIDTKKLNTLSKKQKPFLRKFTKRSRYEDTELPPVPLDLLKYCLAVSMFTPDEKRLIDRLFEKRPVWVRPALSHFAEVISNEKMKYLLPTTGYFATTGPFRRMWVRHGYNYHNDPSNYIYQVVEITKNSKKAKFNVEDHNPDTVEKQFYFTPNSFPLSIVANYQLCDIHLPEVKEMLKNASLSETCSKDSGWLKKEFLDNIRSIMYEYLDKAWQKYLTGNLHSCEREELKLYSDYMEEDNLDYTKQLITKKLEKNSQHEEENDVDLENDAVKDKYEQWAALDRKELAKIIFLDTPHTRTEPEEVSNSNPCSDDEDYVDFKIENLDI